MILQPTYGDSYLNGIRDGSIKIGLGLDVEDFDNHLRFKYGNFNVILGQSNVGKTDFIIWYLTALSVKHKLNWLIFSSENTIGSLKQKIIQFKTGTNLKELDEKEFIKANTWLNHKFTFINTDKLYTAKDLIDIFEEHKDRFDGAIIDPYNSLIKTGVENSHDYDYQVASELRMFCKRHNKTVYVIAHAVTESLRKKHRKDHEYEGFPIPPDSSDIEGGGKWVNRADDFIVVHRYVQHPTEWMYTQIHVRKVKETETGGKPTFIDNPISLNRMYQKFMIGRVDVISGHQEPEKPLPLGEDSFQESRDKELPF